jgi:predicted methyltransferase
MAALLLAGGACKKESKKAPEGEPKVTTGETAGTAEPAVDPAKAEADKAAADKTAAEAEEKKKEAEEIAQAMKEAEEEAAKETARFDDALKKKSADLVAKKFKGSKDALKAILASPHRVPGDSDRDKFRHPLETLTFFGVQPNSTVVEVGTGAGWYTEVLAPLVAREGKLVAVSFDPNGPADSGRTVYGKRTQMFLAKSPELFGKVELALIDPPDKLGFGPDGSADLAIVMREMHNWQRRGQIDAYLASIHKVLKDGGKLGVEQHRAPKGANAEETAEKGYLPEEWLVQKIESAGFKLEAKSEVNANKKDTKDYEQGVWTLPPNYAEGEKDKAKYTAIGESDRMTLRFVKVAAAGDAAKGEPAKAGETGDAAKPEEAKAGETAPAEKPAQ